MARCRFCQNPSSPLRLGRFGEQLGQRPPFRRQPGTDCRSRLDGRVKTTPVEREKGSGGARNGVRSHFWANLPNHSVSSEHARIIIDATGENKKTCPERGGPDIALDVWVTQEQEGLKGERVPRHLLWLCNPDTQSSVWAIPPPGAELRRMGKTTSPWHGGLTSSARCVLSGRERTGTRSSLPISGERGAGQNAASGRTSGVVRQ